MLVKQVVERIQALGGEVPEEIQGREESVVFSMPKELRIPTTSV